MSVDLRKAGWGHATMSALNAAKRRRYVNAACCHALLPVARLRLLGGRFYCREPCGRL